MIGIITIISGGTGTPKLLQGLIEVVPQSEITVIANTGEDVYVSGLRVSPDLDTVMYTLAGMINVDKWYGIEGDTFYSHEMLGKLGHKEILKIGDKDRAIKLYRTLRMEKEGATLSETTEEISNGLDIQAKVLPMSDDRVITRIITENGEMPFHEYWVLRGAKDKVEDVKFLGEDNADPAPGVSRSLNNSEIILIGPSNPITSVGPILAVSEIRSSLEKNRDKVVAISPIIGEAPVSGPTGDLMKGLGHEVTPRGVAKIYQDFLNLFVLHKDDMEMREEIEDLGVKVLPADILISNISEKVRLSEKILDAMGIR